MIVNENSEILEIPKVFEQECCFTTSTLVVNFG